VSSVNGGATPDSTAARERPKRANAAKTIDFFAPAKCTSNI